MERAGSGQAESDVDRVVVFIEFGHADAEAHRNDVECSRGRQRARKVSGSCRCEGGHHRVAFVVPAATMSWGELVRGAPACEVKAGVTAAR